jgi:competence protein ComEC
MAAFLGAARYQSVQPTSTPESIDWYNDLKPDLIVEGEITEPPDVRDNYTYLRVSVNRFRPENNLLFTPVKGMLLARVYPEGEWRFGDRIRLEGHLETPAQDDDFSYREYLARQGIYSYMANPNVNVLGHDQGNPIVGVIYTLKEHALEMVYQLYPDPEASLLAGILLGVESGIPQDVQDAFEATGTSHIIAISG